MLNIGLYAWQNIWNGNCGEIAGELLCHRILIQLPVGWGQFNLHSNIMFWKGAMQFFNTTAGWPTLGHCIVKSDMTQYDCSNPQETNKLGSMSEDDASEKWD